MELTASRAHGNGQGSVTFGGIDTAKFTGQLQEAPLVPANNGQIPSFVVDFSSIELSGDQNASSNVNSVQLTPNDGLPPVLLDTGNPLVSIPEESAQGLARALGTTFDVQNGFGAVPCNIGNQGQKVTFGFNRNQAKVSVPLEMLLVPSTTVGLNGPPMAGETNGGNATGSNTSGSVGTQSDGDMDNSAEDDAESQGGRNSTVVGKGKGKGKGKDRGGKGQGGKGKGNRRGGKSNRRCNRRNRRGKCRNRHRTGNRNGNRFGNRNGNRNNRNNRQSRAIASSRRILARQAAAATGQCFLAVDASRNGLASLGAPFFQAAYVVFDNEQQRLLVAQAVVNSTTTNLQYLSA
ncbi:hypothetical protein BKA66DRAFT_604531 [Pyrenochaeta sp. MPI-SDFR-AT-0127]|nr:hypothetical protein BKA66DRAFT_604531 [Pyrenochaeta sp. MPI-SDFR-AT-0127]